MLNHRKKNKSSSELRKNGSEQKKRKTTSTEVQQKQKNLGDSASELKTGKKRKHNSGNFFDVDEQPRCKKRTTMKEIPNEIDVKTQASSMVIIQKNSSINKATSLTLSLSENYDIKSFKISSASKIHAKVTQILKILSNSPAATDTKNSLLILEARSNVCCKMISIVEIVKREIVKEVKGELFQYNVLEQELLEREQSQIKKKEEIKLPPKDGEETEIFEIMKTPFERAISGVPKVRLTPLIKIYLSRVRIEDLKKLYGEQTVGTQCRDK